VDQHDRVHRSKWCGAHRVPPGLALSEARRLPAAVGGIPAGYSARSGVRRHALHQQVQAERLLGTSFFAQWPGQPAGHAVRSTLWAELGLLVVTVAAAYLLPGWAREPEPDQH
jgi:hypothetical protein